MKITLKQLLIIVFLIATIGTATIVYSASRLYIQDETLIFTLTTDTVKTTTTTVPVILYQDDFDKGTSLQPEWVVENGASAIIAYVPFVPPSDHYTIQCRVQSSQLGNFALILTANEAPIIDSISTYKLVMSNLFTGEWIGCNLAFMTNSFTNPVEVNTYYILEMKVTSSPYRVCFSIYSDGGALLGTYTTGETTDSRGRSIPNMNDAGSYSTVKWVALESWGGPSTYAVDWIKVTM